MDDELKELEDRIVSRIAALMQLWHPRKPVEIEMDEADPDEDDTVWPTSHSDSAAIAYRRWKRG